MKLIIAFRYYHCFSHFVMKKTSTILAIGSALAMGNAQAEIESSFHVGYSTDYVFRGINVNDALASDIGMYEYGLNFTGESASGATWNAGIWHADIGDALEETDVYASISKEFGCYELSLGVIRYDYTAPVDDTTELALGLGTEIAGLDVAASIYYDIDAFDGDLWGEISVGKSFDVGGGATLDLAANFGSSLDSEDDYTTLGLSASVSKELGDNLTGAIHIAGEQTDGLVGEGDDLYGGISLSYGF